MKPIRVVLVEPLGVDFKPTLFTKGNSLEPVALEWLAAYVDKNAPAGAFDITIIQQRDNLTDDQLLNRILGLDPDVVGFSMRTYQYDRCKAIAASIKAHIPGVLMVVGGQHPSIKPGIAEDPEFDVVVVGEGEVTFLDVLTIWRSYLVTKDGSGATTWDEAACSKSIPGVVPVIDGRMQDLVPRARVCNFDELPTPVRDADLLADCRQWNISYPNPELQRGYAQVSWSRGCNGKCTFCTSPIVWRDNDKSVPVRTRSIDSLVSELNDLKQRFNTNYVYFNDLSFNCPSGGRDQLLALCRELVSRRIHNPLAEQDSSHIKNSIHWFALCKVGIAEDEAKAMADAGCTKVGIGVESLCGNVVRSFRKQYGMDLSEAEVTLKNTDQCGIINRAYVIIGSPEDPEDVEEQTVNGLLKLPVDQIRLAFFSPYPGTEAWQQHENDLLTRDWSLFSQEYPVVQSEHFTVDQLQKMRTDIALRFYTDERYLAHCLNKVEIFPHLKESFEWHFRDLERRLSDLTGRSILMPSLTQA